MNVRSEGILHNAIPMLEKTCKIRGFRTKVFLDRVDMSYMNKRDMKRLRKQKISDRETDLYLEKIEKLHKDQFNQRINWDQDNIYSLIDKLDNSNILRKMLIDLVNCRY